MSGVGNLVDERCGFLRGGKPGVRSWILVTATVESFRGHKAGESFTQLCAAPQRMKLAGNSFGEGDGGCWVRYE